MGQGEGVGICVCGGQSDRHGNLGENVRFCLLPSTSHRSCYSECTSMLTWHAAQPLIDFDLAQLLAPSLMAGATAPFSSCVWAHLKRGKEMGGIGICLPVHCLTARPDRQPYSHTNAISHPC